jgi:TrkA domain protein
LLRGRSHPDLRLDTLAHLGIHDAIELNEVEAGAEAVGQSATTLDLRRATGVVQIAVIRRGEPHYLREPDFRYEAGDTAVVVGTREALDRAAELFRTRR